MLSLLGESEHTRHRVCTDLSQMLTGACRIQLLEYTREQDTELNWEACILPEGNVAPGLLLLAGQVDTISAEAGNLDFYAKFWLFGNPAGKQSCSS